MLPCLLPDDPLDVALDMGVGGVSEELPLEEPLADKPGENPDDGDHLLPEEVVPCVAPEETKSPVKAAMEEAMPLVVGKRRRVQDEEDATMTRETRC